MIEDPQLIKKNIRTTLNAKKQKQFHYLYTIGKTIIIQEIDAVESIFLPFVGPRGSGKSTSAIKLALDIDPAFTADQIGFTKLEMLDIIDAIAYTGSRKVAIMDEFGAEMMARNWYEESQKILVSVLQAIRETQVSLFVCLPHLRFADYVAEALANFCFELYRPAHITVPYRIAKMLEIHGFKSSRRRSEFKPIKWTGQIFHVPFMDPVPEYPMLFQEYTAKKREYIRSLIAKSREPESERELTKKEGRYLKLFQNGHTDEHVADVMNVTERQARRMRKQLRDKDYRVDFIPP